MATSINRAIFSGWDFQSYLDELRNRTLAQFTSTYNDFSTSSMGQVLFDHQAFGLESLSFYVDRRYSEQLLQTARTEDGVSKGARQLGYKLSSAVASSVDLQVSLTQTYAFDVTIPAGFKFRSDENLVFEASESVIIAAGTLGPVTVPAYEGETFTENFVSDGSAHQSFQLRRVPSDKYVVAGRVTARVNGAPWERQDFLEYGENNAFEVTTSRTPPIVDFGDGLTGNIPPVGAPIVVTYVATSGKVGRVSDGTISTAVNALTIAFQNIPLVINNPEGAVGGDDPESLEQARAQAGRVYKTREVAVTREDHETLAGSYAGPIAGRVAVAKAFVARSTARDVTYLEQEAAVTSALSDHAAAIAAATTALTASLDAITAQLTALQSALTSIGTSSSDIDSTASSGVLVARNAKNVSASIAADATTLGSTLQAINVANNASDALTDGTLAQLLSVVNSITSEALGNETALRTLVNSLSALVDEASTIGLSVSDPDSLLLSAETARQSISSEVGNSATPSGMYAQVVSVDTEESAIDDEVLVAFNTIGAHLDKILADECKSNLVSIPILARNKGGFYAAPTVQLLTDLQAYLDERKEITQVVNVVSGVSFLVPAVVTVRAGISTGYSESVLRKSIEAAVDGVLRDRAFGDDLQLDELYDALNSIEGLAFKNVRINGSIQSGVTNVERLDADGNLIIAIGEVATKGSLTISTEIAEDE